MYTILIAMAPKYSDLLKQIQTGNLSKAQESINKMLQQKPNDAWLMYLQGNAYRKMGNYMKAYNCYLQANEIDDTTPAAEAMSILSEIYNFRNKDLYNQ